MPRRFYLLLTLTLLAGAFLRLWQLTDVPPGLHYDLAATALLGNQVAFEGYRPIFIQAFTGHEVLFYYWLALWFRLVGSSIFTLRLAAALLGLLTLAATFFAVREVLRATRDEQSHLLAVLATALLATAFFHVTFSRFGFRAVTEPLIQSLALGFLFRGLNDPLLITNNKLLVISNFILAGFFTGLAAYTYLAARLFPIPLAIFWLTLFLGSIRATRQASRLTPYVSRFTLYALSALITFAPLGLHFIQHPEDFLNRANQVVPRAGEAELLLTGLRRAAEMLFINGEPYDRFNLPGLPMLYPIFGLFFLIGLLMTLRNFIHPIPQSPSPPIARATELLLLTWLPAMLIPTALSVHDIFPSNVRALGVVPLLFVFPARGLAAAYRWLQKVWPGPLIPHAYPLTLVAAGVLAYGAFTTFNNYFNDWAHLPNQRLNNDADLTAIADYLNAQDLSDTEIFVSTIHYRHPTFAYLARDFGRIRWFTGGASLAFPADRPALYVFAASAPPPEEWIAAWGPYLMEAPASGDFRAYRFAAGQAPPLPGFTPLNENFGNLIFLTGYRTVPQTDSLTLDVRWRVENLPVTGDFLPYARIFDSRGEAWTQSGGFSYPSEQWAMGDTLLTRITIPLSAGLPPDDYTMRVGLYSESTALNLPRLAVDGGYAGERAPLTVIHLTGNPNVEVADFIAANPMQAPVAMNGFDSDLQLLGYTLNTTAPRQGETIHLTLFWHARAALNTDSLNLIFGAHTVTETLSLSAGQVLIDRRRFKIPARAEANDLSFTMPSYGSATLAHLDVQPVARLFTPPPGLTETHYRLGNEFELYGYTQELGPPTRLRLVWQSLAPSEEDYTVFVHLLGAEVLADQRDAQPQAGAYPTSLWVPGEFIVDDYEFGPGRGEWRFEVGLYVPKSGVRLSIFDSVGTLMGDSLRLPIFQIP